MKTVLLCRVSSKEQEDTGYSLPAQEKLLRIYAESRGFEIGKVFPISESAGGKKQREVFNGMMTYASTNNIKIIVIEKADRYTRNFKDSVILYDWLDADEERQLHSVKDSLILHKNSRSQEKLNWDIRIVFAKNYIDNLSEEVKKGQKEKIAQGWLPTKPPTGYKTIGEKGHKIHVVDEKKVPLIREMFELVATGNYSVKKIAEVMKDKGLTNDFGKALVKSRIHRLLRDPFYCGKLVWNNKIYEGKQEPLISEELFNKIQDVLTGKRTPKFRKHSFEFQGLIRCGECGCLVTWEIHKGRIYGRCNHYKPCTQKSYIYQEEIEEQLLKYFDCLIVKSPRLQDWIRRALKEHHHEYIEARTVATEDIQGKMKKIIARFDHLYDDKIDGKITEDFYKKKLEQYKKEETELKGIIDKNSNARLKYYQFGINFYDISQKGKEIYKKASPEDKKEFIRMVFDKLILRDKILSYEYSKPYKILYEAIKATNNSRVENNEEKINVTFELEEKIDMKTKMASFFARHPVLLPLVDLFSNRKLEIDLSLMDIKIYFSNLNYQPQFIYPT